MRFLLSLFVLCLYATDSNPLQINHFQDKPFQVRLSKKELDVNKTFFSSNEMLQGAKFTIEGFKIKFAG